MSQVVERLAELTAFRDRDQLDATLVTALRDLLKPELVALHRLIGDERDRRWLMRARIAADEVAPQADPLWIEFDTLPRLGDEPLRLQAVQRQAPVREDGPPARLLLPLMTDRDVAGVLELRSAQPLAPAQQQLVESVLRIYRNFQALLDYSERDTLTGLLNRKTFDDTFYKLQAMPAPNPAVEQERRQALPVALQNFIGVIDIDHFKSVNDRFGHLIGDEVLLLVSRLMRATFRFNDRLFRFGGEEFVVLLACDTEAHAHTAFERFRSAVQAMEFPQVGHISVSVGFTELRAGDTANLAFERADQAVYWVKTNGRNQVASHGALVLHGELNDESRAGDVELF